MKQKKIDDMAGLSKLLGLPPSRGLEAQMKARLTKVIVKGMEEKGLTHQELADLAKMGRTTVTGIINHSLQKVSIDRLVRLISALGYSIEFKVKKSA
jgi:predicted XRE-type DNA-binding protein